MPDRCSYNCAAGYRIETVTGDSSFAALDLLHAVREHFTVVTRLRFDAALYGHRLSARQKQEVADHKTASACRR